MTIAGCLAIISAVLILIIIAISRICRELQDENLEIKAELENEKKTVVEAYKYAEELARIQKDKSDVNQKINEAKTSEEINEIINSIVAANNNKLRK